ncbi:MAG: hypothetical protein ACI9WU_002767 [Myxococcota bacterium]|jgi:hypothetical protein
MIEKLQMAAFCCVAALLASGCGGETEAVDTVVVGTKDALADDTSPALDVPDTGPPDASPPTDSGGLSPPDGGAADTETPVDNSCPLVSVVSPAAGETAYGTLFVSLTVQDGSGIASVVISDSATGQLLHDFGVSDQPTTAQLAGEFDVCAYGTGEVIFSLSVLDTAGNGCNKQISPWVVRCPGFFGDSRYAADAMHAAVGDITGDGVPDIVTASGPDGVQLLQGRGGLRFRPPRLLMVEDARFVALDDLDLDGDVDLVLAGEASIRVALASEPGALAVVEEYPTTSPVLTAMWVDVARDSEPDGGAEDLPDLIVGLADGSIGIAVRQEGPNAATVLAAPIWIQSQAGSITALAVGPFGGATAGLDVVAIGSNPTLLIFDGDGEGGFLAPTQLDLPAPATGLLAQGEQLLLAFGSQGTVWSATVAELASDNGPAGTLCVQGFPRTLGMVGGRLVVGNAAEQSLWVRLDNAWQLISAVSAPGHILEADLDDDGISDAVIVDEGRIQVIGGAGQGRLRGPLRVTAPIPEGGACTPRRLPERVTVGDFISDAPGLELALLSIPDGPQRTVDVLKLPQSALFSEVASQTTLPAPGAALGFEAIGSDVALATSQGLQLLKGLGAGGFWSAWESAGAPPTQLVVAGECVAAVFPGPNFTLRSYHVTGTEQSPTFALAAEYDITDASELFGLDQALIVVTDGVAERFEPAGTCVFDRTIWDLPDGEVQAVSTGELDGKPGSDVVVTLDNAPHLILGDGAVLPISTATDNTEVAGPFMLADINGDGWADVLSNETTLRARVNRGDGTLLPDWIEIDTAPGSTWRSVRDVDGDGCPDLLTLSQAARSVEVQRGKWASTAAGCKPALNPTP